MLAIRTAIGAAAFLLLFAAGVAPAAAFEAELVLKDHVFTPAEVVVPAGERITFTVDNQDAAPEEFDSSDLKVEKIIPGKSKGKVSFGPLTAGSYSFMGEFNASTAQGTVRVE